MVNYHNITPPELMAPWDNHLALGQLRAQGDLRLLAPRTALAVADSAYNEAHLAGAGFAATAVVPPSAALDAEVTAAAGVPPPGDRARRGARWLAVGRVSPNKALESTIAALRRRPRPRRPGRHARDHRQAGDGLLRRRAAPLRGRPRSGCGGALRGPCRRRHRGGGLRARGRAGGDVGARGLLRARGRGDVRRPAGGGVRPGCGARGAGWGRRTRLGQGPVRVGLDRRRPPAPMAPVAGPWSRRAGAVSPSSTSIRPPTGSSACWSPWRPRVRRRRERRAPVRPHAAPGGRGRAAHPAPARRPGGARHQVASLRRADRPRDGSGDAAVHPLRRGGRAGGRAALPVRHGVRHRSLAGGAARAPGGELSQRHAAGVLRALGQRPGAAPAPGPAPTARVGPAQPRSAWPSPRSTRPSCARPASPHTAVVPPAAIAPTTGGEPTAPPRAAHAPAPAGSASAVSPRTRRSSSPSWRSSSPGPTTTPRPRSRWWVDRWCRPTRRPCTASSTKWACVDAVTFTGAVSDDAARGRHGPLRRAGASPHGTRVSGSRCSRP